MRPAAAETMRRQSRAVCCWLAWLSPQLVPALLVGCKPARILASWFDALVRSSRSSRAAGSAAAALVIAACAALSQGSPAVHEAHTQHGRASIRLQGAVQRTRLLNPPPPAGVTPRACHAQSGHAAGAAAGRPSAADEWEALVPASLDQRPQGATHRTGSLQQTVGSQGGDRRQPQACRAVHGYMRLQPGLHGAKPVTK